MATPTTSDFLVVPINGTDLIAFYRGSNISRPLYLSYSNFLAILTQAISGGTKILLQTNGVDNPAQNVLNLIEGTGIDITATAGGVTISANSGTSFITAISNTSDINLSVVASTLSAALTATGVSNGTYGTGTQVPQITVDSKGRITGVTNVAITALGTGTVTSVGVNSGTGINAFITGTATVNPTINITNTLPDLTVGLTGGSTIDVSGTYPNFTIRTNVSTNQRLLGRFTAGAGAYEEITISTGLSLSGSGVLTATGTTTPYTVDNGLSPQTTPTANPNNFQLGGALIQNTTIDTAAYYLTISGTLANNLGLLRVIGTGTANSHTIGYFQNTSNGSAIHASATAANGIGLYADGGSSGVIGISTAGVAGTFQTISGIGLIVSTEALQAIQLNVSPASFNDVVTLIKSIRTTSGTPSDGIGGSFDFLIRDTANTLIANRLISKLTTAASGTRTSQFEITGVNNGAAESTIFTLKGTGQLQLNNYTGATFDGTATKALGVDASGNVITTTGGSGSSLNDTTGILFGGALSATIGGTTFSVTAGIGQIITQTASITGVVTTASNVTWSAVTAAPITNIATHQFTYVLVNSSGTVIQQTSPFTDAQYKTHIIIGILCHIDFASVNLVTNSQNVAYEDPHRLVELITSFGPIKKIGLNIGPNGANLRVNRTSGEAFKIGTNYITDQFEPDVSNISAQTPAKLCRAYGNNTVGFTFDTFGGLYYDDIDPNQYFNPTTGVLNSVGGSKWTIQRLFFFPNNPVDIICYYGVQMYNQFSEARANLEFETFDEAQITAENAVFLGFLFVRHNATALNNPTQAVFLQSGLFRGIPPGGGGSGGGGNSIGQLTGDVTTPAATAPSQSVAATIANNAVTYAKMQAVTATSRLLGSSDTTTAVQEIIISTGLTLTGNTLTASGGGITQLNTDVNTAVSSGPTAATLATPLKTGSFGITVDGVTTIVQVGQLGYVTIPYPGTIEGWTITANAPGNIQFDIWRANGAIPTTSIITANYPTLSGTNYAVSSTLAGWTLGFAAGDVFGFHITGTPTVIKNATLTLRCTKLPS